MKIIYIKWFDDHWNSGTSTTEDALNQKDYIMESIGFYIGEDKKYIRPDGRIMRPNGRIVL